MKYRMVFIGIILSLISACPAIAQLDFEIAPNMQSGLSGASVIFSGTLTNMGLSDVFLNGDSITLSNPLLNSDDSPFINGAPLSLISGQSYTGDLFTVAINPSDVAPDIGTGSFAILGGADPNALTQLAVQNFTVNVTGSASNVPEPGSLSIMLIGASVGTGLLIRRWFMTRAGRFV